MPSFTPSSNEMRVASPDESSSGRPLAFRLVSDAQELHALAPAWKQLLDGSANPQPMRSPGWLLTWWSIYGQDTGRALRVGLFHDRDQLVGLAPMCCRRYWHRPGIPLNRLEFLGSDVDEQDGVCSAYLNLVMRRGDESRITQAFVAECVRGSFGSWHESMLTSLNGAETIPDLLLDAFRAAGLDTEKQTTTEAPFVRLPGSWEAYLQSLPGYKRKYLLAAQRAFEDWAGNDWQVEHAGTVESLARGEALLHALHNHRWREGDGIPGAFSKPRFVAFHQQYMRELWRDGKLDLFWISVRGQPIAIAYQFLWNKSMYLYQTGRRLDVPRGVRPGIILATQAFRRAIARGLHEYDFLGGPAQYKLQFTQTTRPLVQVRASRSCAREWLRRGGEKAIGHVRILRDRFRRWWAKRSSGPLDAKESCKH